MPLIMRGAAGNRVTDRVSEDKRRRYGSVLAETIAIIDVHDVPYLVAGSVAANHWGRPTSIGDLDVLVAPPDAKALREAFAGAGFDTPETELPWLYKVGREDVIVDIIFEFEGGFYIDDQMLERAAWLEVEGTHMRLISAEDFVVNQAMSTEEATPNYWYNALSVIAKTELDWDYLVERASHGPRRVLSLLLYAQSDDIFVPDEPIRTLLHALYGG